jgi:putative Ca2+/H+ antiporter (TMEM165/GDT1 family)
MYASVAKIYAKNKFIYEIVKGKICATFAVSFQAAKVWQCVMCLIETKNIKFQGSIQFVVSSTHWR